MKFLCDQCKTKYQIADEKALGKTLRMKCRKCGHLIEVRAAAAVSPSTPPPAAKPAQAPAGGPAPGPAPRPGAPKPAAAPLASSLTAAKAPQKSDKPPTGALAGAFKNTVRDDEVSAPFDMSDLGGGTDEWYVAVNGVPVGPVRVAEIRRKAANGAVTEDSLAWQEGLDEWRPVRTFPDLAAVVREAIASGRPSLTPVPPEARASLSPPRSASSSARASIGPQAPRQAPGRAHPLNEPAALRSNVVPISSRLATAERLPEIDRTVPVANEPQAVAVVADPFAAAASPSPVLQPAAPAAPIIESIPPLRKRRSGLPWGQMAMVAAAMAFGGALVAFLLPQPTQQIIVQQVPVASAPVGPVASTVATSDTAPVESATSAPKNTVAVGPRPTGPAPSAAPGKGALDLSALTGGRVSPMGENTGDAPKPGQCLSSGQVQQTVGLHTVAVRRTCWDKNPSNKPAANVTLSLTVGPDGSPQGISASGDEPSVATCIASDAHQWHFPAMGCSQAISIPFHFIRQ